MLKQQLTAFVLGISVLLASFVAFSQTKPEAQSMKLNFGAHGYLHRWSKSGQNEFTPDGQDDLTHWRDMVTINVHEEVVNGDQLAALANSVLSNYQRSGKILRTDSKPRTKEQAAEHLIVAILAAPGVAEGSFARVLLVDGVGVVAVYSHRAYGEKAAETIGRWLQANGPSTEATLMSWKDIPKPTDLKRLPQSR